MLSSILEFIKKQLVENDSSIKAFVVTWVVKAVLYVSALWFGSEAVNGLEEGANSLAQGIAAFILTFVAVLIEFLKSKTAKDKIEGGEQVVNAIKAEADAGPVDLSNPEVKEQIASTVNKQGKKLIESG